MLTCPEPGEEAQPTACICLSTASSAWPHRDGHRIKTRVGLRSGSAATRYVTLASLWNTCFLRWRTENTITVPVGLV